MLARKAKIDKSSPSSVKFEDFAHCFLMFFYNGTMHPEIFPEDLTANKKYYLDVMSVG